MHYAEHNVSNINITNMCTFCLLCLLKNILVVMFVKYVSDDAFYGIFSALFSNMKAVYFTLVMYNACCRYPSRSPGLLMCITFRWGVQFMLSKAKQLVSWVPLVRLGSKLAMQSITLLFPAHTSNSQKLSVKPIRVLALLLYNRLVVFNRLLVS